MKKILILSLSYYPKMIGGAELAIKEITDRIGPKEAEFHMITNRYDSTLPKVSKEGAVTVHRIGFSRPNPSASDLRRFPLSLNKHLFQCNAAFAAWKLNRTEHFDIVWAMMAHSCAIPAGIFKTLNPKVKYVLTLQEGDPLEHIERLMRPVWPLFARGFKKADTVQAISTFLGAWARRRGFTGSLEIIPNGVDVARFAKDYPVREIEAVRTKLGKKVGDIFLITTSRLVRKNAVDDILRALPDLPATVRLLILGEGSDEASLKKLANDLGVAVRVQFLGAIPHAELPKYLKASDIFVRPSRSEGMGISFIEAMAAGIPVIATQEGGIADFLFDHNRDPEKPTTGFAVEKDAPGEIAQAVSAIVAHPGLARTVALTAKAMVIENYDWDKIAGEMKERVFDPLLETKEK